ncbi:cytochrome P450, partial [Crucibulum laeve]
MSTALILESLRAQWAAGSLVLAILVVSIWALFRSIRLPLPPGPPPKFLIGNLLDFNPDKTWLLYTEWGKQFNSDILHAEALGTHVIVLNRLQDAINLLEKRAHNYSDRPGLPMISLMGWEFNTGLMRYGDRWRLHRRIYQQNLRKRAAIEYQPIQIKKVQQLLRALLATPDDFYEHNKTVSVGITMASVYGYDVAPVKDHFVEVADEAMGISGKYIAPSAAAVNVLPWLRYVPKWFPGAGWKATAEEISKLTLEMLEVPMDYTKKTLKEGTASKSLVSELLENNEARAGVKDLSERDIKAIAATIYGGASDTTISSTLTFFFAMALNPDVQRKAQEEIERVIGTDRLPTYEDRASLPYIEAMYREVMRWRPPLPLGVPHLATDADTYKGYYIPTGAVIVPNIWAMTHDETVYNEPERFYPDRYFAQDGNLNDDDEVLAFGFGRRKCVGKHMASSTVWLVIVSVLAIFDIEKEKDAAGNVVEINDNYTDNAISLKLPFKCVISPRSVDARRLVAETAE